MVNLTLAKEKVNMKRTERVVLYLSLAIAVTGLCRTFPNPFSTTIRLRGANARVFENMLERAVLVSERTKSGVRLQFADHTFGRKESTATRPEGDPRYGRWVSDVTVAEGECFEAVPDRGTSQIVYTLRKIEADGLLIEYRGTFYLHNDRRCIIDTGEVRLPWVRMDIE